MSKVQRLWAGAIEEDDEGRLVLYDDYEKLAAAARDLAENAGAHDGPCTNEGLQDEACNFHISTAERRRQAVLDLLR